MGEPKSLHFYDFGIWEVSRPLKTNYFVVWRPQDTSRKSRKSLEDFWIIIFRNLKISQIQICDMFGKDGRRKIPTIRLTKSWKLGYEINTYQNYEMEIW